MSILLPTSPTVVVVVVAVVVVVVVVLVVLVVLETKYEVPNYNHAIYSYSMHVVCDRTKKLGI